MKQLKCFFIVILLLALVSTTHALPSASAYFSPNGGIRDKIIAKINLSQKSIKLAIYSFTSGEIAWALENAKDRGVAIQVVADKGQAKGKNSEINFLLSKGIPVKLLQGKGRGIMHHKFAIFDDKEVVTGSYNWTENAEKNNYENAVFISDPEVVKSFGEEFGRLLQY
ncbi:MAG: phospholipase D-like domain-containing protein [bacterium]